MPGSSRRLEPSAPRRIRDEAGFALVEVMVSAVLLIVLSLSTLSVIDRAQSTSSNNRSRDVAAQLAQSELDVVRQMPITALSGGFHPQAVTKTVGNIPYTVTTSADWVTDSGGSVTCSTSGRVAYLASTSSVTWPGMGAVKPVTADAIVDPGVAALSANKGALTVLLSRADGTGTPGITVTANGVSAVTDDNGCAVLANLDVGSQTLTYAQAGFVDKDGINSVSKPVTIGAGTIAQTSGFYDTPGAIHVDLANDGVSGAITASWPTVSYDHAQRTTPTLFKVATTGSQRAADASVFPFSSAYKTYVGDCTGNDPVTYGRPSAGAQVDPGQSKTVSLPLRTVQVNVNASAGGRTTELLVAPERSISPMSSCAAATFSNPAWIVSSGGNSSFKIALPYGVWRICANYQYTNGYWAQRSTSSSSGVVVTPSGTTGTYAYVASPSTTLTMPSSSSGARSGSC